MLADGCVSPDTVHGTLLVSTFGFFNTNITWYYSFWILLNITGNAQYYSILLNITQYYQYYQYCSILLADIILEWSWIASGYYSTVTNITQHYQHYQHYIILPTLHNITNQRFTNITQYCTSNITQYSIRGSQYQYYSILLKLLNYTYSIFLNIPNHQNCAFPIQHV